MTRYRKCSAKDLQNRLQFINRHLETLNSIKRELLEESELRMEIAQTGGPEGQTRSGQSQTRDPCLENLTPPVLPPVLIRQVAIRPPTPPPIEPTGSVPVLQFLEEPDAEPEDNMSLASNEINNIEQELKESLEKLSLAKMKKTLSRSKPSKII
jgi:hypothetical protein